MNSAPLHLRTSTTNPTCRLHPLVLFNILDHHVRRNEGQSRVIGTLTGTNVDGVIEIRNCFPVPHTEGEQVGVVVDFHHKMLDLYHKVAPKETIVGWYATGGEISENSVMLHDFYGEEMTHQAPIHLTVDTLLQNGDLGVKAFTCNEVTLNGVTLGYQFLPVPVQIQALDAEKIGVDLLVKAQANPDSVNSIVSDLDSLESSIKKLKGLLESASQYVESVLNNKVAPNHNIGRFLADTISALPRIEPQSLEKMFNNTLQDLLLVVYLANLTRTQLTLAEKLQKVV